MYRDDYGSLEELKEILLYRRVVEWTPEKIVLDDGTEVTIEMSESDCCASAGGEFANIKLDAAITDVVIDGITYIDHDESEDSWMDGYESTATVKLYHNQNEYAQADLYADAGNAGYYYSVASLRVKDVYYPIVASGDGMEGDY